MTRELHQYLEQEWIRYNNKRYWKYFEEWIENLTDNQIYYFTLYLNGQ